MLMDLLHGFEVLSTTEETLFNSRNVSRLVQNNMFVVSLVMALYSLIMVNSNLGWNHYNTMHFNAKTSVIVM